MSLSIISNSLANKGKAKLSVCHRSVGEILLILNSWKHFTINLVNVVASIFNNCQSVLYLLSKPLRVFSKLPKIYIPIYSLIAQFLGIYNMEYCYRTNISNLY